MEQKAVIMDENAMRRAVARITYEILERNRGAENLCIVGILSRGVVLAERIAPENLRTGTGRSRIWRTGHHARFGMTASPMPPTLPGVPFIFRYRISVW